ncbi:hypothetical protein BpHYR1_039892 [Brachionus plicatilis]|uniref:Uncharacterized protein n=1 Tax=Brachionus plicatilis TaxID=10195 RepID=A0A3M7RVQ9_BRAPC|nr:hypothetical protein BpHYR1_039892 [Brachionus plicatilis]
MRTRVAGNTDGYVHSLMTTLEKQRSLNGQALTGKIGKRSLIDLNQFNDQYSNSMASNTYQAFLRDHNDDFTVFKSQRKQGGLIYSVTMFLKR